MKRMNPARRTRTPTVSELVALTDDEFEAYRSLIRRAVGIELRPTKRALLNQRLRKRLVDLGIDSWGGYIERIERDPGELSEMIDRVTTNETSFFRDARQFEFVRTAIVPSLIARDTRRVTAWSAGCSTGEEAYSLAMVLRRHLPSQVDLRVLGTDVSERVIDRARAGVFTEEAGSTIPKGYLHEFMLKGRGTSAGTISASPELRGLVRFEQSNLLDPSTERWGRFDLVFCRNVLIYFAEEDRSRILERLCERIVPGGTLFLGSSETAPRPLRRLISNVYEVDA